MPWIFLFLMLVNAVYFGWKFLEGQPSPSVQQAGGEPALVEGKKIVLLSEQPSLLQKSKAANDELAEGGEAAPVAASTPPPQCYFVGPFTSDETLKRVSALMGVKGFQVRTESRKVEEKDFWVFIPPFTSRERAEERLRELKARGVDGFVVRSGVFANSISLNHFSKKELAASFQQKMKSAGISVESREIKRPGAEFWLYLASTEGGGELRGAIDESLKIDNELRREVAACDK